MIPIDFLKAVKTVITHANCPDGLASAILIQNALPDVKVLFLMPSTPLHRDLPASEGMLFCDISPHPDHWQEFRDKGAIVLDHHKTAHAIVEGFGDRGVFADEAKEPGVSGATIAFREVWRPLYRVACGLPQEEQDPITDDEQAAAELAMLAGIRDTWQRESKSWPEACDQAEFLMMVPAGIWMARAALYPYDIDATYNDLFAEVENAGILDAIKQKRAAAIAHAGRVARRFTTKRGTRVVTFEGIELVSDAAELLHTDADLVIAFGFEAGDAAEMMRFSCRSHTTFDCAAFAKHHGGGGHTQAAGFYRQLCKGDPQPYSYVAALVRDWEEK